MWVVFRGLLLWCLLMSRLVVFFVCVLFNFWVGLLVGVRGLLICIVVGVFVG